MAGLVGVLALAGLIVAVIIHQNRKHSLDQETRAAEEKKTDPVPGTTPIDPAPQAAGTTPEKATPGKEARHQPGRARYLDSLLSGTRLLQFRTPSARPEYIQNRSGETFSIDAPFERVRRIFPQDKRLARDTVVVWQSHDGVAGLGEQLTVDVLSGQTGMRVKRLEFLGDGKNPRCDLSPDGGQFASVSASGSIAIWNLSDESMTLQGFDPYADKPEHKKAGLAAIYFTSDPGHFITVSTAGAIHLFRAADRKQLGEFIPPQGPPIRLAAGKNLSADEVRASVVLAAGGVIYQVSTAAPLSVAWKLDLGEGTRQSLGIAAVGVPGRIAYAFEAGGQKPERGVLFCMPNEKPVAFRLPEIAGEPTGIRWSGTNMAVVATTRGALWVESAEATFLPFALAVVAGDKALHDATESYHWYLVPNPTDGTRSILLALALPPQNLLDFRSAARAREPLFTVRLDEKGLWK